MLDAQYQTTVEQATAGLSAPLTITADRRLRVDSGGGTAGAPSGGVQTVQASAYESSASITRTNDTNVYGAADVIGAATGSTAAITFASIGPAGGGKVMITTAELELDIAAVLAGMTSFTLYLYSVTPPSALGDNAAWDLPSGDRASFKGFVNLGTPVDLGSTLYVQTLAINKQITVPSGGSLFGYLVTVGGYTPAASSVFKVTLHASGF